MKILFYINTLSHGGAERVISNLANNFSERDDVVMVTSFACSWEYPLLDGVKRINLSDGKISGFINRNIRLTRTLRGVIEQEKPNVVVSFMAEPNFRAIMATRGTGVKTVVSVRNDPNREYSTALHRFLAKLLYRFADGVVFQTEDAKAWFPKKIQEKSKIIMNQVDDRFFNTFYDGERRDIVTTGRLTAQKNHKMLIKAFSLVADKISDNLIIYGEGELRGELEAYVEELGLSDRVFLPGAVKDVPQTIKSAKLFVLSSDYEGMPNSLVEAMALGLPCISTDCPCGGPKMLLGDIDGCLVEVGNFEEMAKAIVRFCTTADLEVIKEKISSRASLCKGNIVFGEWEKFIKQ